MEAALAPLGHFYPACSCRVASSHDRIRCYASVHRTAGRPVLAQWPGLFHLQELLHVMNLGSGWDHVQALLQRPPRRTFTSCEPVLRRSQRFPAARVRWELGGETEAKPKGPELHHPRRVAPLFDAAIYLPTKKIIPKSSTWSLPEDSYFRPGLKNMLRTFLCC